MAGKFLQRLAIIDTINSEHRTNAIRKRRGLTRHPIRACSCGCPDVCCGAFHNIDRTKTIPTPAECEELLAQHNRDRKAYKRWQKRFRRLYHPST